MKQGIFKRIKDWIQANITGSVDGDDLSQVSEAVRQHHSVPLENWATNIGLVEEIREAAVPSCKVNSSP